MDIWYRTGVNKRKMLLFTASSSKIDPKKTWSPSTITSFHKQYDFVFVFSYYLQITKSQNALF